MRHQFLLTVADLCLIALATIGAQFLRDNFEIQPEHATALLPYLGLTVVVAVPVLSAFGLNRRIWRLTAMPDYMGVTAAVVVFVTAAVVLGFVVNRLDGVARSLPVIQAGLIIFSMVGLRVMSRIRHRRRPRPIMPAIPSGSSEPSEIILIVGINPIAELYLKCLAEFVPGQVRVAGLLDPKERHVDRLVKEHRVLGSPDRIDNILRDLEIHGVTIARIVITVAIDTLSTAARDALLALENSSTIKLELFAENLGLTGRGEHGRAVANRPVLGTVDNAIAFGIEPRELDLLLRRRYWHVRRALDVVGSLCALLVLAPLMVMVALLVAIDIGSPFIFWQQRPGVGGRPFKLFKFRTMCAAHDAQGIRIVDEERLSFTGQMLRRFRIDELPQLYNVLIGEMSFVGPRPLLPKDQFPALAKRLAIRPGLTGWATIKGGRNLTPSDKAALDIWYVRNASFRIDLKIVIGTLRMIVFGERADPDAVLTAWAELGLSPIEQWPAAA